MLRETDAAGVDPQAWDEGAVSTDLFSLDLASDSGLASARGQRSESSPGRPPSSYFRRGRRVLEQGFTAPLDRPIKMRR